MANQEKKRYVIRAEDEQRMTELMRAIQANPDIEILDEIGPKGRPHTLVTAMTEDSAETLRNRFDGQVIIELDRPLTLSSAQAHRDAKGEGSKKNRGGAPMETPPKNVKEQPERKEEISEMPEQATSTQPQTQPGSTGSFSAASAARATGSSTPAGKVLAKDKRQYVISPRRLDGMMQPMALQPQAFDFVEQALRASPDIDVIDRIGPKGLVGTLADGLGGVPAVLVAKMDDEKAEILKQQSRGQLIIEHDQPLHLSQPSHELQPRMVTGGTLAGAPAVATVIIVLGKDNLPIKDAEVYLFGSLLPASGITDDQGKVTLSLIGETVQTIRALYVKPKSDYWTFYQAEPALDTNQANIVFLRSLSDTFQGFPRQQIVGWGQKAMRLDQLPGTYRGQGVKVGIVDSGAATTHQDLQAVKFGFDIVNKKTDPSTWNQDTVSHGSHCAGVVAGADNALGIRGFAPDAEIHACKLFPGGQISQLIDALEYCIEKQIDVVNLSLGGSEVSEALEQQILRAKRLGVACIVAAGNSGGPVEYPASSPNVLAVAAIGKLGEFPADSYHAQTVSGTDGVGGGFFSPKFTCSGPEVAVCAPGVAILSCVPPNNYAVWDGTSMAAPHVTGLAALVFAHHPDFQGPFKARNSDRVDRLFQILKASAQPVNVGDPRRTGFGLPDVLLAVGLAAHPGVAASAQPGAPAPQSAGPIGGLFGGYPGSGFGPYAAPQLAPQMAGPFAINPQAALYNRYAQLGMLAFGPYGPALYQGPQVPVGVW